MKPQFSNCLQLPPLLLATWLLLPACAVAEAQWSVTTVFKKQEGINHVQLSSGGGDSSVAYATHGHGIRRVVWGSGVSELYAGNESAAGLMDGDLKNARFQSPEGLCWMSPSFLIVADRGNLVIRIIDTAKGVVSTLAGKHGQAGTGDGNATAAQFGNKLEGVLCLPDGSVLIADAGSASLRLLKCVGAECPVPTPTVGPSPPPGPAPAQNTGWSKHSVLLLALGCFAAGATLATSAIVSNSAAGNWLSNRIAVARSSYLTRGNDLHQPLTAENVHSDAEAPASSTAALATEADLLGLEHKPAAD